MRIIRSWESLPLILTVADVCRLLEISKPTALKLLNEGTLSGKKLGNKWVVDKENLKNYLRS